MLHRKHSQPHIEQEASTTDDTGVFMLEVSLCGGGNTPIHSITCLVTGYLAQQMMQPFQTLTCASPARSRSFHIRQMINSEYITILILVFINNIYHLVENPS